MGQRGLPSKYLAWERQPSGDPGCICVISGGHGGRAPLTLGAEAAGDAVVLAELGVFPVGAGVQAGRAALAVLQVEGALHGCRGEDGPCHVQPVPQGPRQDRVTAQAGWGTHGRGRGSSSPGAAPRRGRIGGNTRRGCGRGSWSDCYAHRGRGPAGRPPRSCPRPPGCCSSRTSGCSGSPCRLPGAKAGATLNPGSRHPLGSQTPTASASGLWEHDPRPLLGPLHSWAYNVGRAVLRGRRDGVLTLLHGAIHLLQVPKLEGGQLDVCRKHNAGLCTGSGGPCRPTTPEVSHLCPPPPSTLPG